MKVIFKIIALGLVITTHSYAQNVALNDSANLQEATKLHAQVVQFFKQNKFDEALPLAKKVVELREKELKDNDHLLAVSYINLAYIYRGKVKYSDSEINFRRAFKVEEKRLGETHPDLYDLLVNIAWVCHGQGKTSDAEDHFKQSLVIKEKQKGLDHKDVADALRFLALFYQKSGSPEKALPIYHRMLSIQEKVFGEISNEVKETVEKCACAMSQLKKINSYPEADNMWERARQIERKLKPQYEHLTGGVLKGKATKKVAPRYPPAAKEARITGAVLVNVLISEDGKVVESKTLCGADLLSPEAEAAARKWEFSPVQLDGKPTKVQGILTFNFTLQ